MVLLILLNIKTNYIKNSSAILPQVTHPNITNSAISLIPQSSLPRPNYYRDKFNSAKTNIKNIWNIINSLLNKNCHTNIPPKFNCGGQPTSDPTVIANAFNNYFTQVGPSLNKNIPRANTAYSDYLKDPNMNSLFFTPVIKSEIYDLVTSFKNNKSPGVDGINTGLVKYVISHISDPLCHIFNLSLSKGTFPDKLKYAKVTPIFKSGDSGELGNYRPISVLSCFSKMLEKIVYSTTVTFLNKYNLLCKNQYGFRPGYSTYLALIDLTNKVVKAFEDNAYVVGLFLNISKAFDTINHDILLDKLSYYGIRGTTYDWFASYLSNRSQCTKYESCLSDFKYITCGVPQGSLL